jgi:hypothetical protein
MFDCWDGLSDHYTYRNVRRGSRRYGHARRRQGGLGDYATDCAASVRSKGTDYVFAGSQFKFSATVPGQYLVGIGSSNAFTENAIKQAVESRGYANVGVSLNTFGKVSFTVTFTAVVDQGSTRDVEGNVAGAIEVALGAGSLSSTNLQMFRPTVEQICAGNIASELPKPDNTIDKAASSLEKIISSLSFPVAIGLGVGLIFLLKR